MRRLLRWTMVAACMVAVLVSPVLSQSVVPVPSAEHEACPYCSGELPGQCPDCERHVARPAAVESAATASCCGHLAEGHSSGVPCCDPTAPQQCPGPCPCCSSTLPIIVLMAGLSQVDLPGDLLVAPVNVPAIPFLSRVDEPQSPVPRA